MPAKSPATMRVALAQLQEIGRQIRARRKDLGVNATVAAESAGMSRVTWYRIEKGEPSVAAGAYANALTALGLVRWIVSPDATGAPAGAPIGWLPAVVRIADYPQLKRLAWNLPGTDTLSPRDALAIYQRNWRHVDETALEAHERALVDALQQAFSGDPSRV